MFTEIFVTSIHCLKMLTQIAKQEEFYEYLKNVRNLVKKTGFQTTLQAAGFIWIKSSRDNIEGV
jgi:hypothetical protein